MEHENKQFARLGSIVTNFGYSDWSTTDIPFPVIEMRSRLNLKGQDVFIESANNNSIFKQKRFYIFINLWIQESGFLPADR
jgi:uncharacterized protein